MRTATFVHSQKTCTGTQRFFYDLNPAYVDPETRTSSSLVGICITIDGFVYVAPAKRSVKHGYMLDPKHMNIRVYPYPRTIREALIGLQVAYVRTGKYISNIDLADYGAYVDPIPALPRDPFGYERIKHESAPRITHVVPIGRQHRI